MSTLSIFSLVVRLEIDIITAKPYILEKIGINEFVQNSLFCSMGMVIFDFRGMENVRGQKHYLGAPFDTFTQRLAHPPVPFCIPKIHQEMRSVITFSLHSASISQILEPSPQGLISSVL